MTPYDLDLVRLKRRQADRKAYLARLEPDILASDTSPSSSMRSKPTNVIPMMASPRAKLSKAANFRKGFETGLAERPGGLLADYLGHVENGQTYRALVGEKGVGTFGGSQDRSFIH